MKGSWTVPRILTVAGIIAMVVGGVGFLLVIMLNAFVLDEFAAYGQVPIPGSGQVQLPAGEVQISFHTSVTGSPSGSFPIPALKLGIDPPAGAPEPVLTENRGTTTTVNSDTHIRIWTAQVPVAGVYRIRTAGEVNGYINPRLAFGHGSSLGYLHWAFAALFGVGLLDLIMSLVFARRRGGGRSAVVGLQEMPQAVASVDSYAPTDEGVRLQQLKTISALRDSGAMSPGEFEAEKRRILGG